MKENFFGEEIEKIVFISEEQLKKRDTNKIYGKFFEDTNIYNIFSTELQDKGEFLCEILPENSNPSNNTPPNLQLFQKTMLCHLLLRDISYSVVQLLYHT